MKFVCGKVWLFAAILALGLSVPAWADQVMWNQPFDQTARTCSVPVAS